MLSIEIALVALGLFVAMVCFAEIGRQLGRYRIAKHWDDPRASFLAVEGSVFGLMALLVAFTFSSAATRYETRRELTIQEAAAIATAWRSLGLLPPSREACLRDEFRRYIDVRLAAERDVRSHEAVAEAVNQ